MEITRVRLEQLEGMLEHEGPFWEEPLVRPIDVYPEHRAEGPEFLQRIVGGRFMQQTGKTRYLIRSVYVHIETDEGLSGLSGPIGEPEAFQIDHHLAPILIGEDPRAVERIWDKLYRFAVHGRKGTVMMAISALDCGLWDLRGKWAGAPVYRLLGGPTRESIPAYASALGFSLEPEAIGERARALVEQGYRATKWFFRHGPAEGREGMAKNVELARTLREAVGDDVDIMFDAWMSFDVPYTVELADRIEPYRPRWLEEPVMPDKIEACAEIRASVGIPIATGEHEYTRWGIRDLIEAGAADVLQPDVYWAGGLTEMVKICALASTYDLPVVPHGHSVPATVHLIASQPPTLCPILEYLIKWNEVHQFFLKDRITPQGGSVALPDRPGLGMELDDARIERREDVSWG